MIRSTLTPLLALVTKHNLVTLLAVAVLTGIVVGGGVPQIETGSQAGADGDAFEDLETVEKAQYIGEHYTSGSDRPERTFETVLVRADDGNVLSRESLLAGLRYQRAVSESQAVRDALHEDGIVGIENLVARRAAGSPDADLDAQIAALESSTDDEVRTLVATTLSESPRAMRFLPADHDPGETTATDRRLLVAMEPVLDDATAEAADQMLYEQARDWSGADMFVVNGVAYEEYRSHFFGEMIWLVLPVALLFILLVLGFAYRDLVDVAVGMVGVVLSVLWMFGLLGWMDVSAGLVSIVPVVLVTGLSIDFGFHVFNRYREQRGPEEDIRAPMARGVRLVATALVLVTVTAAIGFLANLSNPLPVIRNLGVSITLGVVSSLVVFVTAVPALKITVDELLERVGLDRRKQPLGHGRLLRPALERSVGLARRAAPVVVVLAVVVGGAGAYAWTDLDRESFQQADGEVAEWKQQLPDPVGWESHPTPEWDNRATEVYQPASAEAAVSERILIEGDVTAPDTLDAIATSVSAMQADDLLLEQPGTRAVTSPLSAMERVAARDESFAGSFQAADTDGDGVPDGNLTALYDGLYAADADLAGQVIERTDGEYRSVLLTVSLRSDYADSTQTVSALRDHAAGLTGDGTRTATVAGNFAVNVAVLDSTVDGIVLTMLVALAAILVTMAVVFRSMHGSAGLGIVVALPILLVVGTVIGGMYLLGIPLTLLTALLMSLVVGLGVDYNIHIGDRYADERREGQAPMAALRTAVTGTGGALLGSTLTSAGAFATIALVPHPQLRSFGLIVVVALVTAFLVSVLVLPSALALWSRYAPTEVQAETATGDALPQD